MFVCSISVPLLHEPLTTASSLLDSQANSAPLRSIQPATEMTIGQQQHARRTTRSQQATARNVALERQLMQNSLVSDEILAADLKSQLESLQEEYAITCKRIATKRYKLSPPHVLPLEILGEIFIFTSYLEELAPLNISQVCRKWRSIIRSTPRAWYNVHIRLNRKQPAALAAMWFEYSRACPVHVAICDSPDSPPMNILLDIPIVAGHLRSNWCRVRVLRMYRMGGNMARQILEACRPALQDGLNSPASSQVSIASTSSSMIAPSFQTPIVRHIALNLHPPSYEDEEVDNAADFRDMDDLFGPTPLLSTFRFDRCVPSFRLPVFAASTVNLKSIEIDEPFRPGYTTPLDGVFTILAECSQLHVFLLAGNQDTSKYHETRQAMDALFAGKVIHLPHLRMMSLQSVDIPFFLDHITCPLLEKLKLGNDLDAFWYGSVANSLRSLVERSNNPPLSRLRINDISTPSPTAVDEWACFDALPLLSSFRVYASSFPDALLESLSIPAEGSSKALCPDLNKIVFEDCLFSGDTLVKFVESRTEASKLRKPEVAVTPISELWIGTCPNIRDEDRASLSKLLGDVFKLMADEDTMPESQEPMP